MAVTALKKKQKPKHKNNTSKSSPAPWAGFRRVLWPTEINVRDFIQQNYTPYEGDEAFLAPAKRRTRVLCDKPQARLVEEYKRAK